MKIINYLSVFIVFSGAFVLKEKRTGVGFDFYFYYLLVLVLLPVFAAFSRLRTPKILWIIITVLLIIGLINVLLGNNEWRLLVKQLVGITVTATFFYYLLKANNFDYLKLFGIYMNISKIIALIAIIQVVAYLLHIRPLYDFSYFIPEHRTDTTAGILRANSILMEPSHYVVAMAPAIFICVYNIFNRTTHFFGRFMSAIVVLSVILTFSTTGYLCLILSVVFLFKNPLSLRKVLVTAVFFVVSVLLLYNTVPLVTSRIDGLVELFVNNEIHQVNISSFTIFNNFTVASQNFLHHPVFGSGLGSHQVAFDLYAYKNVYDPELMAVTNTLNKEDANSLFLRLLSETGLIGLLAALIFILKFKINDHHIHEIGWIVSTSILILIITKLVREGNYFNNGFPLFLWMYYYIKKQY